MHRDKKVGLALAILLCSIVGAFFFRDDAPRTNGPELKDPQKLDQEIAHRGREPYREPDSRTRDGDPSRTSDRLRSGFNPNDLPDFLREGSTTGQSAAQRNRVNGSRDPLFGDDRSTGTSNPSVLTPPPHDAPAVPIPLHNSEWDIAGNDNAVARRSTTEALTTTTSKSRTHTVVDGETLSSIAGKYLGSQTRYQEVFQANRDQLKSPNDLKIGMKLIIPDRAETRATSGSRSSANAIKPLSEQTVKTLRPTTPSTSERSSNSTKPSNSANQKLKFGPAKAGPAIRRTTDAGDEESLGKTLSQIPPQDLSEIDESLFAELERDWEAQTAEKPTNVSVPRIAESPTSEVTGESQN